MKALTVGLRVEYAGEPHVVTMVNKSRAVIRRERGEVREFRTVHGETIHIKAHGPEVSISPRSELPVLGEMRSAECGVRSESEVVS